MPLGTNMGALKYYKIKNKAKLLKNKAKLLKSILNFHISMKINQAFAIQIINYHK